MRKTPLVRCLFTVDFLAVSLSSAGFLLVHRHTSTKSASITGGAFLWPPNHKPRCRNSSSLPPAPSLVHPVTSPTQTPASSSTRSFRSADDDDNNNNVDRPRASASLSPFATRRQHRRRHSLG